MKDPAFLFYSSDFMTGTMFLTNEQVGKYIRLLCAQHLSADDRLSEKHMISICGTLEADIIEKFTKDEAGFYYNERLRAERVKRSNYSQSRYANKKGKKKEIKDVCNISKSYDIHMGNENINKDIDINTKTNKTQKFKKPTIEEIEQYASEKNLTVDAERFFNFYESKGWLVGKSPMKDWRAALRNWAKNNTGEQTGLNYLSGKPESDLIAKINGITDEFLSDVEMSKFQFNDQFTVLYHTELQKFISWDTMVKCPKIGKVARSIFTARSINHLLTPATYGQRNKTA